jgi:hypothetical protein
MEATVQTQNNHVVVEGTVVGRWTLDGDTCYRLAVRRVRGVPGNPDGKNFDAITVRLNYFLAQQAGEFPRGSLVRVQGLLQQRDAQETLQRALERLIADDNVKNTLLDRFDGELTRLRLSRSEIEVVVFGWEIVRPPRQKAATKAKAAPVAVESKDDTAEAPAEGKPGKRTRGKKSAPGAEAEVSAPAAEAIAPVAAAEAQPAAPAA